MRGGVGAGRRRGGNWVQERDLEFFKGATRGPVERDYGKSATAEERAVVQVASSGKGPPWRQPPSAAAPSYAVPQSTASPASIHPDRIPDGGVGLRPTP